jgi:threonine dehydrogenase-like Zn-dependent dehydrogenase
MKALAVKPSVPASAHIIDVPLPSIDEAPGGKGVLVRTLALGVCGTDRSIYAGHYGEAPPGSDFLIIGHENFGQVQAVGPKVSRLKPGDYVVSTVRRAGSSIYDLIGAPDFTTDARPLERGISRLHGFFAEHYVEHADYMVKVPQKLSGVGVLIEPLAVVQKGIRQAFDIQRRLPIWRPQRAAVMGAGTIGLLATMSLRVRGLDVVTFDLPRKPYRNSDMVEALEASYESAEARSLLAGIGEYGSFDIIFEATGFSPVIFDGMQALAKNGVLILSSITTGNRYAEVPSDRINLEFVMGNKVMVGTVNAGRFDFETAVNAAELAEMEFPGWLDRMITHRVHGIDNYQELFTALTGKSDNIKICCIF